MDTDDGTADPPALAILELLAEEAPHVNFTDLLRDARQRRLPTSQMRQLRQAIRLALDIRGSVERKRKRESALATLVDTAQVMANRHADALKIVTRRARLLLDLDMTYVSLQDPDGGSSVHESDGETTAFSIGLHLGHGMGLGDVAQRQQAPFWSADYLADERFSHCRSIDEVVKSEGLHAILAVPMANGEETLGALYGASRTIRHFSGDEVSLMRALATLAASAMVTARRLDWAEARVTEAEQEKNRLDSMHARTISLSHVQSRLIDLALDGGDLCDVVATSAEVLGGVLCVRDADGRTLSSTGKLPHLDDALWVKVLVDSHGSSDPVAVTESLWAARLTTGFAEPGVLLCHSPSQLTAEGRSLLRTAGQAVALVLLRQGVSAAAEPARDEYLDDLLSTAPQSARRLTERARRLKLDPDGQHLVLVLRPEGGRQGGGATWAASYAHRHGGIRTVRGECVVLLLPGEDASAAARAAADELSSVCGHAVTAGAAGPTRDLGSIKEIYAEAQRCLDTLTNLGCTGRAAAARDLGFLGLLLSDNNDVDGFISSAVGPVLDYDAQRSTDLVATLEAYFTTGGSPTRAAQNLHVHPNTVTRRLERIAELLSPDWQEPGNALEIQLALRLHQIKGPSAQATSPQPTSGP